MSKNIDYVTFKDKLRIAQYFGFITYSLYNLKFAVEDLSKYNNELNSRHQTNENTSSNLNELGRLDRILKDYIILKIAMLFDKDNRTLSLIQLNNYLLKLIPQIGKEYSNKLDLIEFKYKKEITKILDCRHQVVAHAEKNKFESLLRTDDLLAMPIVGLLDEISSLIGDLETLLTD